MLLAAFFVVYLARSAKILDRTVIPLVLKKPIFKPRSIAWKSQRQEGKAVFFRRPLAQRFLIRRAQNTEVASDICSIYTTYPPIILR
jgi:hypothetical protein